MGVQPTNAALPDVVRMTPGLFLYKVGDLGGSFIESDRDSQPEGQESSLEQLIVREALRMPPHHRTKSHDHNPN